MREDLYLYNIVDKYYHEKIEMRSESVELLSAIKGYFTDRWNITKQSVFYCCTSQDSFMPDYGWKIHVSSSITSAKEILTIVAQELIKDNINFKFIMDLELMMILSQKPSNRAASGKFITIYPKDDREFFDIIERLYSKLKNFDGPYILSDRRYKDCKVLYYRYGGFKFNFTMDNNGNKIPVYLDKDGMTVEDRRVPYFYLPNNVRDIIEVTPTKRESYLSRNYSVIKALHFSNSGGVYEGIRLLDGKKVVIKEARPNTCIIDENKDAIYLLEKEYDFLRKVQNYNFVPQVVEIFKEWEHSFLVEEFIDGTNLHSFCAQNNPIFKTYEDTNLFEKYLSDLMHIFKQLVNIVYEFHNNNLIIADLSPKNIMVTDKLEIKIIDLEACINSHDTDFVQLKTDGFSEKVNEDNLYESDIYSLGCIMFYCLTSMNHLLTLDDSANVRFLDSLFTDYNIPIECKELIINLMNSNPKKRYTLSQIKCKLEQLVIPKIKLNNREKNYSLLNLEYKSLIDKCLISIKSTADFKRKDRLFPNTPLVANALNIAYGALGNIYVLDKFIERDELECYVKWISDSEINDKMYPPGLYVGLSGIAWVLLDIGEVDTAKKVLHLCENNPTLEQSLDIKTGQSGYGMTLLKFWMYFNNKEYLDKACSIGEYLYTNATIVEQGTATYAYWKKSNDEIGYGEGCSGIALFLLYLYKATKDNRYLRLGEQAISYDLLHKIKPEKSEFYTLPKSLKNKQIVYPYYLQGSAGVISVIVRYYNVTKNTQYLKEVSDLIPSIHIKYALSSGLFYGLSGLGNSLLDCYKFTGNEEYLDMAYDVAEGVRLHAVQFEDKVLFPGEGLSKLSTDFGGGTCGVILFLDRLVNREKNYCFNIDEILSL